MKKLIRHLTRWAWRDTLVEAAAGRALALRYGRALYRIGVLRHKNPHTIARKALDRQPKPRAFGNRK